ncbi:hypothetical protein AAFF_G00003820 [Aldrovandia affinis]|uniref:Allorecognition 1 n=1 Tax=Aldrovandia affinis TaxID=143900 RepID=A0AAD7TDR0_9TELE|nr:hypothetical protein AAFF_G00003820 [Aldrovandia affinis]
MSHSKQLASLSLLLVLWLCTEHTQARNIQGSIGMEITIPFNLKSQADIKTVNLYKNNSKIGECPNSRCSDGRYVLSYSPLASLSITNLTSSDAGEYYIALLWPSLRLIESEKMYLIIRPTEFIRKTPPTSASTEDDVPEPSPSGSSAYVYLIAFGVIVVVLPIVLLTFFCLTHGRHSDSQLAQRSRPKCQVTSEASSSMPVCSIEYVMLDFPNTPGGREEDGRGQVGSKPRDCVEYATITFPQGTNRTMAGTGTAPSGQKNTRIRT